MTIMWISKMKKYGIIGLMCLAGGVATAQVTGGYWGNQYGSRGLLLNGAVIASCDDETALFYNPAGLGLTTDFGVAVSLITPTYNYVNTKHLLGEDTKIVDKGLGLAPGLVAAKFRPFDTDKINVGISIFKRFESKVNYTDRVVSGLPADPTRLFVGEIEYERELSETWIGIGMSFELHELLSLGFSQFFTWRSEEVDLNFKKEFILKDNPKTLISSWRSRFKYGYGANGGMLTKLGLSWRPSNVKFGLTYTSSTYALALTSADYKYNESRLIFGGVSELSSNDRSTELNEYKTPWSIGAGIAFTMRDTRVSFSTEYFQRVNPYAIIDDTDDPLDKLSPNSESITKVIKQGNEAVLNIAIGLEKTLNNKYSWFVGARTDFSPQTLLDLGEGISFLSTNPDVYHISVGGSYVFRESKFSVGLDYGFGIKTGGQQFIDLSNITDENLFTFDGEKVVNTQSHSLALFVTYDL